MPDVFAQTAVLWCAQHLAVFYQCAVDGVVFLVALLLRRSGVMVWNDSSVIELSPDSLEVLAEGGMVSRCYLF